MEHKLSHYQHNKSRRHDTWWAVCSCGFWIKGGTQETAFNKYLKHVQWKAKVEAKYGEPA